MVEPILIKLEVSFQNGESMSCALLNGTSIVESHHADAYTNLSGVDHVALNLAQVLGIEMLTFDMHTSIAFDDWSWTVFQHDLHDFIETHVQEMECMPIEYWANETSMLNFTQMLACCSPQFITKMNQYL